jgi:endogenous inhibitor of DNA gyrase (YacG/DUF329 family)
MMIGFITDLAKHLNNVTIGLFLTNSLMTKTSLTYPCPRCHTPTTWTDNPNRPFCSERCKLIDLGAWASEDYKIAAEDSPFSDDLNNSNTIN